MRNPAIMVCFEPTKAGIELYIKAKVLFFWLHTQEIPLKSLYLPIIREISSYFPTYRYSPLLSPTQLYLFDLEKASFLSLGLDFPCSPGSRCAIQGLFTVLITGGGAIKPQAYRVTIDPGRVDRLEPMSEPRNHHGSIYYRGFLWVFGGSQLGQKSAERWENATEAWGSIVDMHFPRSYFTPCAYEGKIYLPEISEVLKPFEMLDICRLEFFLLPFSVESRDIGSVSCLIAEEIVLITHTGMLGRWSLRNDEAPMVFSMIMTKGNEGMPSQSVLVHSGNWVYVVGGDREMLKIDLRPVK